MRCEIVIGIVLCYSHQACCLLYYLGEINSGITCTSLLLNLYISVFGCGCGFGFEQKFWRIDGFGDKARIDGFAYPYSPPSLRSVINLRKLNGGHGVPCFLETCSLYLL